MYYSMTFIDPTYFYGVNVPDPGRTVVLPYDLASARNTWQHWRVVPTSRPSFSPPPLKTSEISIDGMNGKIDLSQALTGYPTYGNRTGSIEFAVINDFRHWQQAYDDIMNCVHGKQLYCVYEEDPEWYYVGRWTVSGWDTGKTRSTVTLNYDLEPYKYRLYDILGDWLWDPFNFQSGTITSRLTALGGDAWNPHLHRVDYDIVDGDAQVWDKVIYTGSRMFMGDDIEDPTGSGNYYNRDFITNAIGNMPVSLYIHITPDLDPNTNQYTEMQLIFTNTELNINPNHAADSYTAPYMGTVPNYIVSNFTGRNNIEVLVRGHGTIRVNFKPGRL